MIGIYKITNKINGNAYIGQSVDIQLRFDSHRQRYLQKDGKEYNKVLYCAMRKYGLENFSFEVLEECAPSELAEREIYWIAYYDTYKNGYNATPGGDLRYNVEGENHPNHKITEADVIYIRQLWASKTISTREMYYEYQNRIGKSGFKKIYSWQTWKKILPELNTEENRKWHRENTISYSNCGARNPNARLTDEQYTDIKNRIKSGETLQSIFADYKAYYHNYASFYNSAKSWK